MTTTMNKQNDIFDITFVGAGPVALYGMYYAGLRMTRFKAIDMLEEAGGGLMALYPEKYIYDVGGYPKVLSKDLTRSLVQQATQYPHSMCLGEKVTDIQKSEDGTFSLTTPKNVHYSRSVIICTGMGAYMPRRLDLANIRELEGHGIYYCVKRLNDFADKRVLIVGGGDSAFDYSMMLEPVAKTITHIHRNDFFSAHEDSVRKVLNSSVRMKFPFWELKEVEGDSWVRNATIVHSKTGEQELLELDAVIFNLGFLTNLGPLAEWGLELDKNAIKVDSRMRTNIDGIFAAGDIVTYDGKLKLISTGFGEVAIAVNFAKTYIDPKAKANPGHSTDKHDVVMRKVAAGLTGKTIDAKSTQA